MDFKGKFQILIIIMLLGFIGFITYLFIIGEGLARKEMEEPPTTLEVVFNKDSYIEAEGSVSGNPEINDKSLSLNINLQGETSFYEGKIDINNNSDFDCYLKSINLNSSSDINYIIMYNDKDYNSLTDYEKTLIKHNSANLKIRIEPKEIKDEVEEAKIDLTIKYANKEIVY